jgi:hypothetical protein
MIRLLVLALLQLAPLCTMAAWPQLPVPPDARIEPIGSVVRLNGIPMRMQRVLAARAPENLARHYREALGPRHAAERLPDRMILSQARDDYFITVSIRPIGALLTEALVSVTDAREARQAAGRPLGLSLPAGSRLISDMESDDSGIRSRQLVLTNSQAIPVNLDAFTRELAAHGMRPDGPPLLKNNTQHAQLFKGNKREAQLTLIRREGETSIVLTILHMP